LKIPTAYQELFKPKRIKVFYGGRDSAKSHSIARALTVLAASENKRILCSREIQKSIKESVHKLLEDVIISNDLSDYFEIQKTEINSTTGSEIRFEGLKNNVIQNIKSYEGIDILWIEEAETVSQNSWDILLPTIRKSGSEIWISFNPRYMHDATYKEFISQYDLIDGCYEDDDILIVKTTFRDNPFTSKESQGMRDNLRKRNYKKYLHVYEGELADFDDRILIQSESVLSAFDRRIEDGSVPQLRVSVDVADGGDDDTVITTGLHYATYLKILSQKHFHFEPSKSVIESAKAAQRIYDSYDISGDIVVDAIGVGAGTAGWLMDNGYPVVAYKGSESSDDTSRWRNRRVQSYITLYEYFRDGKIILENIERQDELLSQFTSIKRGEDTKVDDLEPKKKIKEKGLPSPDKPDSLAMQCYNIFPSDMGYTGEAELIENSLMTGYDGGLV
jgi:phage terminase large subunit